MSLFIIYNNMTSSFSINRIFEENLIAEFAINDGIFSIPGQEYIVQHTEPIQNIKELLSFNNTIYNEDQNNYLICEYRWSYDTVNWSNFIDITTDFSNYIQSDNSKVWLQFKYKYESQTIGKEVILSTINITGSRIINEIFEPVTLLTGSTAVYTNQDTYKVYSLNDYKLYLQIGNEIDLHIQFRYTQTQGRHWSQWTYLTSDNLKKQRIEKLKFCNFQFAFINKGDSDIRIYDLELIGEFQNITAGYKTIAKLGLKTQCNPLANGTTDDDCCCVPCSEALTPWNDDIENCACDTNNFIQINDRNLWAEQIKLYSQLNNFINETNSWKCTYLLTDPDGKGIDHILHEQQIHNVVSMKDLNIIIPDNQFPVDNISFSGLDLDLIQSFQIHIMKDAFKKTFGVEFRPGKRDVVYICDINQLWEVEQMFPSRGFMNAEAYYRVLMKKYTDKASRQYAKTQDGDNAKSFIDSITKHTTLDGLFGLNVADEIKQNTKTILASVDNASQQHTQTTIMNIRKKTTKTNILDYSLWNASLTVAKSMYELPIKSKNLKLVEYNYTDQNLGKADNRAISFWFKTEDYNPDYDWTILSNYDYTNNLGYKVNIFQGALTFTINNNTYLVPSLLTKDTWYCFLINYDNVNRNVELAIYKRQSENGFDLQNSKLVLVNKNTVDIIPIEYTHNSDIFIGGCDTMLTSGNRFKWFLTNIRIYNTCLDKTTRNNVLNENVVSDAHLTLLVDNAEKTLDLPKYGNL